MDPYLTYDLFRSRMDNESTRRLITESKDIGIVVDSKDAKQHLIFLIRLLDEWNSVQDSVKSFTIVVPDKKARAPFEKIDKSMLAEHPAFQYVKKSELMYPEALLTIAIVDTIDMNLWNDIYAYGIATVTNENGTVMTRDSLTALKFQQAEIVQGTNYSESCKTRKEYYQKLVDGHYNKAAFMQCLEELKNGCQTCPDCPNYKAGDPCPFFHKKIADFYENGIFVPANSKLAFQWKRKAARKGLQEAELSLAKSYGDGKGCPQDIDEALSIYSKFAKKGSEDAARELISLALESEGFEQRALPWMARLANAGDFSMQTKLIDIYSSGLYGIPVNETEQDKWTTIASDSGNIEYVDRLIDSCKERKDWTGAIKWYGKLRGTDGFDKKQLIDLISQYCKDQELNAGEKVALGDKYYWGIGVEEDSQIAYQLYSWAYDEDYEVASEGMGRCYYYGIGVEKNVLKAVGYWVDAADAGDLTAMVRLYHYYSQESHQDGPAEYRKKEAIEALDNAVEYNNPVALRLKSHGLKDGDLYEKDENLAFQYMLRAVESGDLFAKFHLAQYYHAGTGVTKDFSKAFSLFKDSAIDGFAIAQRCVGVCYQRGHGTPRNLNLAFEWLLKAAQRSDGIACYLVGLFYDGGAVVSKNPKQAFQWFLKAAEQGHAKSQSKVGEAYYWGNVVNRDLSLAKKWSVMAAEKGEKDAFFRAAYLCSEKIDGKTEYEKAHHWYGVLADNGNSSALNNLAVLYECGHGVEESEERASELYLKAAEAGSNMGMNNIANRYLKGTGIEKDTEKAIYWYEKSLSGGFGRSGNSLAYEYLTGKNLEKDIAKAIELYRKVVALPHDDEEALEQYTKALMALANIYYNGVEVDTDYDEAFKYYKKAAEVGNVIAYTRLGDLYQYGQGVDSDTDQAIYWYRLAAEKNNKYAKEQLDKLGADYLGKKREPEPIDEDELPF